MNGHGGEVSGEETEIRMKENGLPWWSDNKESVCSAGDPDSNPGVRKSPGEGNDNPLQYSCLENSLDRGAWQVTVHGATKSQI